MSIQSRCLYVVVCMLLNVSESVVSPVFHLYVPFRYLMDVVVPFITALHPGGTSAMRFSCSVPSIVSVGMSTEL